MTTLANRHVSPDETYRLPIVPAPGTGVVTPSCEDRDERYPVARHVGRMLRIGGEARLCFDCGPDGGVYHPATYVAEQYEDGTWTTPHTYTMADVRTTAERIFLHDGDGSEPPTKAELEDFDRRMRAMFGLSEDENEGTGI